MKACSSEDSLESLLLIPSGIAFITDGGWLLFTLIYCGVFPGFMKGWCFPVDKFSVTSR